MRVLFLLALIVSPTVVRAQAPSLREGEGYVSVPGGRIWYRVVGHGPRTPLLVIHGCCGVGSYYLAPLAKLADERPVVFYDQIDNGRSDHPGDSTLWRMPQFVEEIARLRASLGLEQVHLYGQGWGASVAAEYMLTKPSGVRSLILDSPQLDMRRYVPDIARLFDQLPPAVQRALVRHERDGTTDSPDYRQALAIFQHEHLSRREPWTAELDSSRAHLNPRMKRYLFGRGLLAVTGTMADYDISRSLGGIVVPTLLTMGRYGYTSMPSVIYYHNMIPQSRMMLFESSGELAMQDEPEWYVSVIRSFTDGAER